MKTFSKPTHHNILGDPVLFQKIIENQKNSQPSLESRVSLGIYNFIKSKLHTSQLQKASTPYSLQYIKNLSVTNQSMNQLVNTLETKKSFDFSHQLSHSFLDPNFVSTKNSILSTQEILLILNRVLLVANTLKTPYTLDKKYNNFLQNSTFSELQSPVKYNKSLETNISKFLNSDITLIPFQVQSEWQDAGYFADEIVFLLERRISFRQIKNRLLKQFSLNPHVQGVRITCSGRVGGKSKKAQRARVDSIKYGQTSLHVFSSQIDFAVRTAHTALGSTGVKVWICYTPSKKS